MRAGARRTVVAAVAATVALVAPAAPAVAGTSTAADPKGDGTNGNYTDLRSVKVTHTDKRVRINTKTYADSRLADEMWHLVDTGGGDEPEFLVFTVVFDEISYPKPRVRVYEVDGWPTKKDPYTLLRQDRGVDCDLHKGAVRDKQRALRLKLGRGCFKTEASFPDRLRANTFATFEWGKIADSAPGWRTYGGWVGSG